MNNIWKSIFLVLLLAGSATGCNTTRGLGQDIEAAGDEIEEAADDAQD